jgi:hypothetical protein
VVAASDVSITVTILLGVIVRVLEYIELAVVCVAALSVITTFAIIELPGSTFTVQIKVLDPAGTELNWKIASGVLVIEFDNM